ncbi:hypothetical protein KO481_26275 [Nocardia sp. NEAU-G5]|uniref:DUF8020 domain-containing protein n=1 Tax=Nocardia albiluteola TaxID=2842303 RepID=A0ABS6B5H2_9NOCA|nr:hypothetical protein [Nocardia albiluteola]MBU3065025.1 hypothetical protein [Nocardia albiluteola]
MSRSGESAVIATNGKWVNEAGHLLLENTAGAVAAMLPLTYRIDDLAYPISAHVDGGTATLTPMQENGRPATDPVRSSDVVPTSRLQSVAESLTPRDSQALATLTQRLTAVSVASAVLGAIVGGGAGCLLGAAVGATSAAAATLLLGLVPGGIIGCIVGAGVLGPVGGIGGLTIAGGPMLAFSAFQYFSTIMSPCTTPGPYCADPANPAASAPRSPATQQTAPAPGTPGQGIQAGERK